MPRTPLIALALLLGAVSTAQAANLMSSRVMSDGVGYLFSFHFDGPITHRHFTLRDHDRLVLDFKGAGKGDGVADRPVEGELVKGIRYGLRQGRDLRIVLDLTAPATYAVGTLEGEPRVLRVTLTRSTAGRFERRELPRVAPPTGEEERVDALPPTTAPAAPPPALPPTSARDLKCLKLVDGQESCKALIDEVMAVTDNRYPNDAPPPPAATFELERPAPEPEEPQGSLGVHRFTKQANSGKARTDIGYKSRFGDSELGVSLLRPSLTLETEAGGGDLRMLVRPDEVQFGYRKQWK